MVFKDSFEKEDTS